MLERLSKDARIVLVLAEGEARSLRHDHVGTLHLLLALLGSQNTAAGQILAAAGLRLAATRGVVHGLVAAMSSGRADDSLYTPKKHRERRGALATRCLRQVSARGSADVGADGRR